MEGNHAVTKYTLVPVPPDPISTDMLTSIGQISAFLGLPAHKVRSMALAGELPIFRLGRLWQARRSVLVAAIEAKEKAATRAA
jgi:hypothetical protein